MDQVFRRRLVAGIAIAVGAVVALVAGWLWIHRLTPERIDRAARDWAISKVLTASDSVYRLRLGRLTVDPRRGSIAIDSATLATDTARNARRPRPLPMLSLVLHGGRVDGMNLLTLLRHRDSTVNVDAIRFDRIQADVRLPAKRREEGKTGEREGPRQSSDPPQISSGTGVLLVRLGNRMHGAPTIHVGRIELPSISATVHPKPDGPDQVQSIEHLAIGLDQVLLDTSDSARNPIYARDVRLRAQGYRGAWSRLAQVTASRIDVNVGDSLLRVDGVDVRPVLSDSQLRERLRWRVTRIVAHAPRVEVRGVDYSSILAKHEIAIRTIDAPKATLDLFMDRNLDPNPHSPPVPSPQRLAQTAGWRVRVDTVSVHDGRIAYAELEPDRSQPGVVTFEHIDGSVRNLSNEPNRMSDANPMIMSATAKLMGSGRFSTVIEIPLLARSFRMRYRGTLGPMPLVDFNRFVAVNTNTPLRTGEGLGVYFDARVIDGRATGRVIPRYRGIKFGLARRGDDGLLGGIKRHVGSFVVNHFKVRRDNPPDPDKQPLVGNVDRQRLPSDHLFPFLWFSLRDALKQVMER